KHDNNRIGPDQPTDVGPLPLSTARRARWLTLSPNRIGVIRYTRIRGVVTCLPDGSRNATTHTVVASPRPGLLPRPATIDAGPRTLPGRVTCCCLPSWAQLLQLYAHRFPAKTLFETVTLLTRYGSLNDRPDWTQPPPATGRHTMMPIEAPRASPR